MKRIEINGKFFRLRRGKLIEIPVNWVGKVPQNINKRQSKQNQGKKYKRKRQR